VPGLEVALLVEVHDGEGGTQLTAVKAFVVQTAGQAIGVEPCDDGSGLCVVEAGHTVEDVHGVVGALATDHEHGKVIALKLEAKHIAGGEGKMALVRSMLP